MTVLTALQSAALRINGKSISTFFSSTNQFEMELRDLANKVAKELVRKNDWNVLTKFYSVSGNGTDMALPLPDDYSRMLKKGDVHSANWNTWIYTPAYDLDQFIDFQNGLSIAQPGVWVILNNEMNIWPVLSPADSAQFYYITRNIVRDANGAVQQTFTSDSDAFLLDEDLITLGVIWNWRAQKRMEYAEDLATYELALAEITGADKGSKILTVGRGRFPGDIRPAYPRALGS